MDDGRYSLRPGMWTHKEHFEPEQVVLYTVAGLSPDDNCFIFSGGKGDDGADIWYLVWYRSGKRVDTPGHAFNSPEDARKAAVAIHQSMAVA